MIHIYGDSHAEYSFKNLSLPHVNHREYSITMFRIGRDNTIINFNINELNPNDIIVLVYGEVDCRCHIKRQINLGRNEDDVIFELVNKYFETIKNNIITKPLKVVVVGIVPTVKEIDHDSESSNTTEVVEYPHVGTNEQRVRYTTKMNALLEHMSYQDGYTYFNPYSYYTDTDGTLSHKDNLHIIENSIVLEKFFQLYNTLTQTDS